MGTPGFPFGCKVTLQFPPSQAEDSCNSPWHNEIHSQCCLTCHRVKYCASCPQVWKIHRLNAEINSRLFLTHFHRLIFQSSEVYEQCHITSNDIALENSNSIWIAAEIVDDLSLHRHNINFRWQIHYFHSNPCLRLQTCDCVLFFVDWVWENV